MTKSFLKEHRHKSRRVASRCGDAGAAVCLESGARKQSITIYLRKHERDGEEKHGEKCWVRPGHSVKCVKGEKVRGPRTRLVSGVPLPASLAAPANCARRVMQDAYTAARTGRLPAVGAKQSGPRRRRCPPNAKCPACLRVNCLS